MNRSPGSRVTTQARRCFEITRRALAELGANLEDVIRTRTYLTHLEDWKAVFR